MVTVHITYQGDLHCEAVHEPSGAVLATDPPKDNHGKGEQFSPTDLVAAALGTCILTVMGIAARTLNVDLRGAKATAVKEMTAVPLRRIGKIAVTVRIPATVSEEQKQKLERAALTCPVHQSLHPDIEMPIEFIWG
ncbi:MAG TPA: OsmC family protein [Rickettsiales bacterium]|nr:OsmC family protein [Rickettsiales bacterium]